MGLTVKNGWIGVDLDGTLAAYDGWVSAEHIGPPVQAIVAKIKQVLELGYKVKIVTARASGAMSPFNASMAEWLVRAGLPQLEITCCKDYAMIELWDDRCVAVEKNTGRFLNPSRILFDSAD